MTPPTPDTLIAALEATWPSASHLRMGPFTLRDGLGGGKRVSAATPNGPATAEDIANAAAIMAAAGTSRLFRLRPENSALDASLADLGYQRIDPTTLFAAETAALLNAEQPPLAALAAEICLSIQADVWEAGGIGPARLAVMDRAAGPKAWLLARLQDRVAGAGFVAVHEGIAMVHALETRRSARRKGAARAMMHRAAKWAAAQGAGYVSVAVTQANGPANALYASLGMAVVEHYHYRIHPDDV
ncbi:MAG: GNAT family N-acetyltransferase [Pseudomonadota bacterium]